VRSELRRGVTIAVSITFLLLGGCSTARLHERMSYWDAETRAHLPVGSTLADAEQFFTARGLSLRCCVSAPPGPQYHFAVERKVGYVVFTQYDVAILVGLDETRHVDSVHVERWGIGL
jgi:hypothetical protein